MTQGRDSDAGLTLVEVLVALVLFALVGLASFAMLDAIIRARDRTEGRLASIAELDRAVNLFSSDLGQSLDERALDDGQLEFSLHEGGAVIQMSYGVRDGVLVRRLQTDMMAEVLEQPLISGIDTAQWRFLDAAGNWADIWPPNAGEIDESGPRAVEMRLMMTGAGTLRRIVELPRQAAQ